ncbi:Piso0_002784 [Millerozyma farinosa CBS 7064]|uniref:Mediator of RNA polymerase II transcription subunit 15 n=1 Tax=Pichia sorbitophila (strain ATCC MYA-4447 / BCRC 22081 / CBS 7064 / NBRC 10061 / NRRL Y-12695) TaxID=559304 RepID=G8YFY9_PICSO|nr:Piso0_002784 [Millerozyma farinosa CBS 7064]
MNMQQPNMNTWHAMYSVNDRQKIVQILTGTLSELQGNNFDAQKVANMAQEFEKFTFMKSKSREEYLMLIKQKVTQLRNTIRSHNSGGNNMGSGNQMMGQNMGSSVAQNMMGIGQQMGMGSQNMNYMQQQAPVRQQPSVLMQGQMRQGMPAQQRAPSQGQPMQPQQQPQQPQQGQKPSLPTQQQMQQLNNMIRNVPIPQALLAKIPNLPPNTNTWSQIFDLFQKKVIPSSSMPIIKEIHNTHIQLALRQHQQQKLNQLQSQRLSQQQLHQQSQQSQPSQPQPPSHQQQQAQQNHINMNVSNNPNPSKSATPVLGNASPTFNLNNLTPSQKQQFLQRQMQQRNAMASGNQNPNQSPVLHQQSTMPSSAGQGQIPGQTPQMQMNQMNQSSANKPPNFPVTPQDIMKYSADAMRLLTRLQANGQIQPNLDQAQKENFIHKYINHQKALLWKQKNGQAPNNLNAQMTNHSSNANQAQVQRRLQQDNGIGGISMPNTSQMHNQAQTTMGHPQPMVGNSSLGNRPPHVMDNQTQMNTMTSPLMQQRNLSSGGANMMPQSNDKTAKPDASTVSGLLPPLTEEMKLQLRQLIEEVSKTNVALKDMTMLLSQQEKNSVKESIVRISQQYANIDSVISYFFILTRNIEGTKRLIQMKYMTKNIMQKLQQGVILATPDLVEKLRSQYQKYFEFVKEQFNLRKQHLQQQRSQAAQVHQAPAASYPPQAQSQFINNQLRNGSIPQNVAGMPTIQESKQGAMNFGSANVWPNMMSPNNPQQQQQQQQKPPPQQQQPPQQQISSQQAMRNQRPSFANNAMMNNLSPVIPNQMPSVQGTPAAAGSFMAQKPPSRPAANKKAPAATPSSINGAPNRKRSAGRVGPQDTIPTPANNVITPASLANAIKTPNSMNTPQVPASHSNKNTPTEYSPNAQVKTTPNMGKSAEETVGDLLKDTSIDEVVMKRRSLSNVDPALFFRKALSNLLELDESTANGTASATNPSANGKQGKVKSPLSPENTPGEWTCEIKPSVIMSSFKQVDNIKDLADPDIIKVCAQIEESTAEGSMSNDAKRPLEEDDNDIENLFTEKKIKTDDIFDSVHQPINLEDWKSLMVSAMD